jgi:N-acetylmuramoyl-L-alanine amidase.
MSKFQPPVAPFVEARNKGGKQRPTLIVLSSSWTTSDKGAALGIANTLHRSNSPEKSFHYVVDEESVFQCVWDHVVALHCGYDKGSIGIKMCDDPSLLLRRWSDKPHQKVLYRLAELTAQLCLAYGIPARFLTDEQLLKWSKRKWKSKGGIVTSAQMSRVFNLPDQQDPKEWSRYEFLYFVHEGISKHRESNKRSTKR